MKQTAIKQYVKMAEFISVVFGPDYEVALHDAAPPDYPIIAIANSNISGRSIGAPLFGTVMDAVLDKSYEHQDFIYVYNDALSADGVPLRSSCIFIKDELGKLIGIFCISFDDHRFRSFSEQVMKLCHPDMYVDSNFIYNKDFLLHRKNASEESNTMQETVSTEIRSAIYQVLGDEDIPVERLTMNEKLQIISVLKKKGLFYIKNAARLISKELACSTASIYRYLSKLPKK